MSIYGLLEELVHPVFQATAIAVLLLLALAFAVRRQIAASGGGISPDEGVSLRNVIEVVIEWLAGLARENMGDDYRRWFPIVGTMFFFILVSNLLGLIPGIGGATSYVEAGAAWAIIGFVVSEAVGIQKHGPSYIKHFLGPVWWLAPFFLILEIPLHFARVITLTIRLLANMFADHTIIAVWLGLMPFLLPSIFMGLGLIVAILQAFVFTLLTMVYIKLALEEAH
ncbi:F0F1 ATP synthase subunit A [Myxococcota bacterium]|nr:F0F1 ATP synthase subunit A [Myxococcota bacterium]